jgi:glutamyl-tRNA synthetase
VLRRGDGAFAYQLAVVVDDLAMGVAEVVRGAERKWTVPHPSPGQSSTP